MFIYRPAKRKEEEGDASKLIFLGFVCFVSLVESCSRQVIVWREGGEDEKLGLALYKETR